MSVQAIAQVLNLELNDVSAKAVLIGLANHTSPDGECFPSVRRLMRYSGLSERAVRETIGRLEQLGLIRVERQPGKRSIYHLQLTPAPNAGVVVQEMQGTPAPAAPHNHKEPSIKSSDARAGLPDDWKPRPSLMSQLDYDYPNVDIAEQVKLFVLHNQSKATVLANPDKAFEMWMRRTGSLKMPVKPRPSPARAAGVSFDPAALARGLERAAEMNERLGERELAAENWLAAAGHWIRVQGERGEDVARCVDKAIKVTKKGSWSREQAEAFKERISGPPKGEADQGQHHDHPPAADQ